VTETVTAELGAESWPELLRTHLLSIQCEARRNAGYAAFPGSESFILEADGANSGWMLAATTPEEVRLVEIMVKTERQGQGIGGNAIRRLIADAHAENKPVRLHVNCTNARAISLYQRLGFRVIESNGVQHLMEILP